MTFNPHQPITPPPGMPATTAAPVAQPAPYVPPAMPAAPPAPAQPAAHHMPHVQQMTAPPAQPFAPPALPASTPPAMAPAPVAPAYTPAPVVAAGASIFDNLTQANIFENSKYFQPGLYIVQITAIKMIAQGYKGDSIVFECKVLGVQSQYTDAPQVGETAAQVQRVSGDKRDIGRATWLGFLCAMFGVTKDAYTDDQWKQVSSQVIDQNALAGTVALLECFSKPTKAEGVFTVHKWHGVATAEQKAQFEIA